MALAENLDHLGIREPLRNVPAAAQPGAKLGSADIERPDALLDRVDGSVLVAVGQVGHHLEGHDLDAKLVLVLLDGVLGVVRAVKVDAGAVLARSGVVPAHDEVRGTVVLADDGVPDGLAGSTHAHGQRQQTQDRHAVGVAREEGLVDAHARKVVNVAGLGQADDGVDEDVGVVRAGSADRQFTVGAVHGVAGLEGDDPAPAELVEVCAQLSGGVPQVDKVVVLQAVDSLELTADVELTSRVEEVVDGRVLGVAAKDLLGLELLVRAVDILNCEDGQVAVVTEVAQSDAGTGLDTILVNGLLRQVEGYGHAEEGTVDQTVLLDDAIVVLLSHEALQRGKATSDDQLQITKLTLGQQECGQRLCLGGQLSIAGSIAGQQVLEDTAVGRVGHYWRA